MLATDLTVRPMAAGDLDDADRIMRTAFGTFLGLPDPMSFAGDGEFVRTRGRAGHVSAFVAELTGGSSGRTC